MNVVIQKIGVKEIVDLRHMAQAEALHQCMSVSMHIYQGTIDGEIACLWGLVPPTIMSSQAYIWLQTFPIADQHTFLLVRYSQQVIEECLKTFNCLVGHCKIEDTRAIRWIRWLGAEFGAHQAQLVPFVIRRKNG